MNELDDATLRDHFLGWQCRIRQIAMRRDGGRPSAGMRPRVLLAGGREVAPAVTVLLVPVQPEESTSFFRHQLRKSNDPRLVYERVLEYLQGTHFQQPRGFSDEMTAVFAPDSDVARVLLDAGECILEFSQYSQSYRMFCAVRAVPCGAPVHEATLWHNRAFNPNLPNEVHVLAFRPDWQSAQADPMP